MVVGVLGHLGLLVGQAAQGAGGAGVLLAAALGLHWRRGGRGDDDDVTAGRLKVLVQGGEVQVFPHLTSCADSWTGCCPQQGRSRTRSRGWCATRADLPEVRGHWLRRVTQPRFI